MKDKIRELNWCFINTPKIKARATMMVESNIKNQKEIQKHLRNTPGGPRVSKILQEYP
jgi:hypothetical protein